MKLCKVEYCNKKRYKDKYCARSVCGLHYWRWKKYKSYELPIKTIEPLVERSCKIPNCKNITKPGNRTCYSHHMIKYRYGSYEKPKKFPENIVKICKIHGNLTKEQSRKFTLKKTKRTYIVCIKCQSNCHKKLRERDYKKMDKKRYNYYLKSKFNLTQSEYDELLKKQNGLCKICNKPETQLRRKSNETKLLSVDHCHKSKEKGIIKIRGLLCGKCNTAIGMFFDSIEILESAIKYLKAAI